MKAIDEYRSFGRYLQTARMEKGIRLDDVAAETRIRRETLLRIENEDYANLPDDVFVKGFIRSFAKAVGADPDEAIRRYVFRREMSAALSRPEEIFLHPVSNLWLKLAAALVGVGMIIFLSVYLSAAFYATSHSEPSSPAEAPTPVAAAPAVVNSSAEEIPPVGIVPDEMPEAPPEQKTIASPQKKVLQIIATEKTWLKIIVDEMEPKEFSLKPGDQLEMTALKHYNLLIGNAGGVRMRFDNEEIPIPGNSGEVVNIRLPEN